jgi:hypothetical protein
MLENLFYLLHRWRAAHGTPAGNDGAHVGPRGAMQPVTRVAMAGRGHGARRSGGRGHGGRAWGRGGVTQPVVRVAMAGRGHGARRSGGRGHGGRAGGRWHTGARRATRRGEAVEED